jgi:hypothetical protein
MTADVYSGDDALRAGAGLPRHEGVATFSIVADAHPDLIGRIGAVLNLFNIAPRSFRMESQGEGIAIVHTSLNCAAPQAELVARKLQQLTCARQVEMKYS